MPKHRNPRRRKNDRRIPASETRAVAHVDGESIVLNVNPNRGKRHLSTLGHLDPRVTNGRAKPVREKTVTRHRAIKPRAHRSVPFTAARMYAATDVNHASEA